MRAVTVDQMAVNRRLRRICQGLSELAAVFKAEDGNVPLPPDEVLAAIRMLQQQGVERGDLIPCAAQGEYNAWQQDETGFDSEMGYGGICQNITQTMADVATEPGLWGSSISGLRYHKGSDACV